MGNHLFLNIPVENEIHPCLLVSLNDRRKHLSLENSFYLNYRIESTLEIIT